MKSHASSRYLQSDIDEILTRLGKTIQKFSGKTLLITGGMGFIGSHLTATLIWANKGKLNKPCHIIVVDNGVTATQNLSKTKSHFPDFTYINHDLIRSLQLPHRPDFIIHAAGIASPRYYQHYALETIDVAVNGTRHMLEVARKQKISKFLYFSSSEIYGDPLPDAIPTPESYRGNVSSIGPRACYDESKRMGETLCTTYHRLFNTPVVIIRPFNVYGPGMRPNDYRVIPHFLSCALKNSSIPIYLKGKQTRTFCYITDAVVAIFLSLLLGKPGEVYNIGNSNEEITMEALAKKIRTITKTKARVTRIPYPKDYPKGEPLRRCPDITKIVQEIGFHPEVNLSEGITRMFQWARAEFRE